jgi:hypothetical protein
MRALMRSKGKEMDTIKIYREAKEFGLDQGLTVEQAVEYAHEVVKREREDEI